VAASHLLAQPPIIYCVLLRKRRVSCAFSWESATDTKPLTHCLRKVLFFRSDGHRKLLDQNTSFVPGRDAWECPSHSPLVDFGVLRYTWSRAVTTGPNTRVEVSVLGRLGMFLKTREPQSCFAGAPTSVWHRSRPSQFLSQRFPETRRQSDSRKTPVFHTPACEPVETTRALGSSPA
jgi:hypothetical protein